MTILRNEVRVFYWNFLSVIETLFQLLGLGDHGLLAQRHVGQDRSYVTESVCQNHVLVIIWNNEIAISKDVSFSTK